MSEEKVSIGVIGGSGLYSMPDLEDTRLIEVDTPFGPPSDALTLGTLNGVRVAFLARHGRSHKLLPGEVPYHANIYALKSLGVEQIVAISACGSLREDYAPGHIVIPDQLFDFTKGQRVRSFFGDGLAAHINVAEPFCTGLSGMVSKKTRESGGTVHDGGIFITIEGPRFSTRGESNAFRSWGMSIIGMTTSPEAFLAREAEICYSVMAHVTDYDVWHESKEPVTVDIVVKTLNQNIKVAQESLRKLVKQIATRERTCTCKNALADAFISDRRKIPQESIDKLGLIVNKYIS